MAFVKGKSGNPSGRPRIVLPDGRSVTDIAKTHTEASIMALADIVIDPEAPHAARISAANSLLDRGWGRPAQSVEVSGQVDGDHTVTHQSAAVSDALEWIGTALAERASTTH